MCKSLISRRINLMTVPLPIKSESGPNGKTGRDNYLEWFTYKEWVPVNYLECFTIYKRVGPLLI